MIVSDRDNVIDEYNERILKESFYDLVEPQVLENFYSYKPKLYTKEIVLNNNTDDLTSTSKPRLTTGEKRLYLDSSPGAIKTLAKIYDYNLFFSNLDNEEVILFLKYIYNETEVTNIFYKIMNPLYFDDTYFRNNFSKIKNIFNTIYKVLSSIIDVTYKRIDFSSIALELAFLRKIYIYSLNGRGLLLVDDNINDNPILNAIIFQEKPIYTNIYIDPTHINDYEDKRIEDIAMEEYNGLLTNMRDYIFYQSFSDIVIVLNGNDDIRHPLHSLILSERMKYLIPYITNIVRKNGVIERVNIFNQELTDDVLDFLIKYSYLPEGEKISISDNLNTLIEIILFFDSHYKVNRNIIMNRRILNLIDNIINNVLLNKDLVGIDLLLKRYGIVNLDRSLGDFINYISSFLSKESRIPRSTTTISITSEKPSGTSKSRLSKIPTNNDVDTITVKL